MKFTLQINWIKAHLLDSLLLTLRDYQLTGQIFCFTDGIFLEALYGRDFFFFDMTTDDGAFWFMFKRTCRYAWWVVELKGILIIQMAYVCPSSPVLSQKTAACRCVFLVVLKPLSKITKPQNLHSSHQSMLL